MKTMITAMFALMGAASVLALNVMTPAAAPRERAGMLIEAKVGPFEGGSII